MCVAGSSEIWQYYILQDEGAQFVSLNVACLYGEGLLGNLERADDNCYD